MAQRPHAGDRTAGALAVAVVAGGGVATQSYVNGRLGGDLGSSEYAAAVSNAIGLGALLVVSAGIGAPRRAAVALRGGRGRPRAWHFTGGLGGASLVAVAAAGAPRLGVALLTVALVCGQALGSLGVDGFGLSPAGRRPATVLRLAGVALAAAAVAVSALGAHVHVAVGLVALATLAGAATALQQAANGHLAERTGEPLVAGSVNFAVGTSALVVLALAVTGPTAPHGWSSVGPGELTGGLLGALAATVGAAVVKRLGTLRLVLAITAGQVAGALVIDVAAPAGRETVGAGTIAGVALAFAAVALTARERGAPRRPRPNRRA